MVATYLLASVIVGLPLALATWRRWPAHHMLVLAAGTLAVAGALVMLLTQQGVRLSGITDRTLHDTYYVVTHGRWILSLTVLFAVLAGLSWAAHHFARPTLQRVQKVAVWGLILGILGPSFLKWTLFAPPKRYVEFEDWFSLISTFEIVGTVLSLLAMLALTAIPLCALLFRRR